VSLLGNLLQQQFMTVRDGRRLGNIMMAVMRATLHFRALPTGRRLMTTTTPATSSGAHTQSLAARRDPPHLPQ
jgi:hypothetical protein